MYMYIQRGVHSTNQLFIWFLNGLKLFCGLWVSSQRGVQAQILCESDVIGRQTVNPLGPSSFSHHSSFGLSVSGWSDPGTADRIRLISKRIRALQGEDCCLVASDTWVINIARHFKNVFGFKSSVMCKPVVRSVHQTAWSERTLSMSAGLVCTLMSIWSCVRVVNQISEKQPLLDNLINCERFHQLLSFCVL